TEHVAITVTISKPGEGRAIGKFYMDAGNWGRIQGNIGGAYNTFFQEDVDAAEAAGILVSRQEQERLLREQQLQYERQRQKFMEKSRRFMEKYNCAFPL